MTDPTHDAHVAVALEAVLLDLDGVLVDTEPWWFEARRAVAGSMAGAWSPADEATVKGANSAEWARALAHHLGRIEAAPDIERQVIDEMLAHYARQRPPTIEPGVRAVRRLTRRYPLAVASSAPTAVIEAALTALGIRSAFRAVVSSDQVGRGKPAPDVYLEAARHLGRPPERCLVIEDSDAGVRAARRAGMRVVLVPAAGHPPGREARDQATITLDSLDELDDGMLAALSGHADDPRGADPPFGSGGRGGPG